MQITKTFKAEGSHIVRNCTSKRCSHSIHGHSYVIDITLESDILDNGGMVCDFGLLKGPIKEYIDSMDHSHLICSKDLPEYIEACKKFCDRYMVIPFNPSAEMLSIWILNAVNHILSKTEFNNGEDPNLKCVSVTVWETTTGRATTSLKDLENYKKYVSLSDIEYSEGIMDEWSETTRHLILSGIRNINPKVTQQTTEKLFNN